MCFKFEITLTDKDYLDCNVFLVLKSPYGKGQIARFRIFIALLVVAMSLLTVVGGGFSTFAIIAIILYAVILTLFEVFARPFFVRTIKGQVKAMKKQNQMAFPPESTVEFDDDAIIEATPTGKSELKYSALERISVVEGKVVYLHFGSAAVCILPRPVFKSDAQYEDFLAFIKTKCENIDTY